MRPEVYTFSKQFILVLAVALLPVAVTAQQNNNLPDNPNSDEQPICGAEPGVSYVNRALSTDTSHCYYWPYDGTEWLQDDITVNTYDEEGLLIESVNKNYDSDLDDYVPLRRYAFTYYDDGNISQRIYQIYNENLPDTTWDNQMEENYSYNEQGAIDQIFTRFSSWNDTSWRNGNREYFYYGAAGKKDSVLTKYWNTSENTWYFSYRHRYYYDEQGELSEEYTDWANNLQGDFSVNIRTLYVRDYVENTLDEIRQFYHNDDWMNDEHYFQILDEDGQALDILYQDWNPNENDWDTLVMMRFIYEYNAEGLETFRKTQSHYIEWVDVERTFTSYYEDGTISETLSQKWQSFYEEWQNDHKCIFPPAQNTPTGMADASLTKDLKIFPNPAQDRVQINTKLQINEIRIYDLTGKLLLKKEYSGDKFQINTEALSNGIYSLRIFSVNQVESRKLVISR